jgi:hypothetical protein
MSALSDGAGRAGAAAPWRHHGFPRKRTWLRSSASGTAEASRLRGSGSISLSLRSAPMCGMRNVWVFASSAAPRVDSHRLLQKFGNDFRRLAGAGDEKQVPVVDGHETRVWNELRQNTRIDHRHDRIVGSRQDERWLRQQA